MTALAIGGLGTPELLIILAVLILLFGAAKLPELARGSGRALRIFKAETKGLMDDDDEDVKSATDATQPSSAPPSAAQSQAQLELEAKQRDLAQRQAQLDAEAERLHRGDSA
jgi:sec-independent protein translocase protein TatA